MDGKEVNVNLIIWIIIIIIIILIIYHLILSYYLYKNSQNELSKREEAKMKIIAQEKDIISTFKSTKFDSFPRATNMKKLLEYDNKLKEKLINVDYKYWCDKTMGTIDGYKNIIEDLRFKIFYKSIDLFKNDIKLFISNQPRKIYIRKIYNAGQAFAFNYTERYYKLRFCDKRQSFITKGRKYAIVMNAIADNIILEDSKMHIIQKIRENADELLSMFNNFTDLPYSTATYSSCMVVTEYVMRNVIKYFEYMDEIFENLNKVTLN